VLVANRGEVAARIFRTLREMEIESVGIYTYEDRYTQHRLRADKSFRIGNGKDPVAPYTDIERIIEVAVKNNVDAIHPGHDFLAKRPEFAERVLSEGISYIGPTPSVIEQMRDNFKARLCAIETNLQVIPGSSIPLTSPEEAVKIVKEFGTPILLKPAHGSGGQAMQYVHNPRQIAEAFELMSNKARKLFGDGSLIIEKFIDQPRHIEIQVLADQQGDVVHLFERDCSLQLKQQKFLEMAPARRLDEEIRSRLYADAIALARHIGYRNAGTVKFLVDFEGKHYFIGMDACLQVAHSVTEEVTGIDIVHSQVRLAEGASLAELGLTQDLVKMSGAAIQCRITSEDPAENFRPLHGRLKVYRIGDGLGIRKDGLAYDGGTVSEYYEPLLSKVISHAPNHKMAAQRMLRCLRESRIRGIETNLNFLKRLMTNPTFIDGTVTTSFVEDNLSRLLDISATKNRGLKLLRYMAEVKTNGAFSPLGVPDAKVWRAIPEVPEVADGPPPDGFKSILDKEGPSGFAKALRKHEGVLITDTTFRDANQSLLATRIRTKDMLRIAPYVSQNLSELRSMENWGGATFQVCMNFLYECPWERLELLRKAIPNVPFQCIFRGSNIFGYSSFPDNIIKEFCKLAVQTGMDIFRIMDCFNYLPNLICGIEAVGEAGGVVEAAIAYTGDVTDKTRERYNLKYYMDLVDELVKAGIHILAIKDMAGVLHPLAARLLVGSIRDKYPDLPIQVHTHDTAGTGVASMLAAIEAGADGVDAAIDSMSGVTSQPSLGAIVRSLKDTPKATGLNLEAVYGYSHYWEETRRLYANFESTDLLKSGSSDVHVHKMPGGQYSNLIFQSLSLNLLEKFPLVCKIYEEANKALGDIIKVAPSSKVVGDLALYMTQHGINSSDELQKNAENHPLPKSVQDFFEGKLGQPTYGFPKVLQEKVLRGREPLTGRPGASLKPLDLDHERRQLEQSYQEIFSERNVMSSVMFPDEFDRMVTFRRKYGPVELLPTDVFFAGPEHHRELEVRTS
ncbi:Precursor of carboxylase pyruvate carboxylase, partial [Trichostrongylus colubriformis]